MTALPTQTRAQYATFEVAGHYLGIGVLQVQEVLRRQQLTPVPLAPDVIAGLINLRGQIIPALEMRRLLRLPERTDREPMLSVVLRTEAGPVSLQVDEIGDVIEIESTTIEPAPLNLERHVKRYLAGVCRIKERLLLLLDTDRTVDVGSCYSQKDTETN